MFDDPDKEMPFSGVFAVRDGETRLVTDELEGPNGLAFSPDERHLYVGNWDPDHKVVMRYELGADDQVVSSSVLLDMTDADGEDAIDGLKVDRAGNVYACGPGGIWIISPEGEHFGTLRLPEAPHNLAWGEELEVQRTLAIDEYTDPHHNATVPHTVVLGPGLVIDKVYVGYWFFGRPSAYQLWEDLQDLFRRIKGDYDPTLATVRDRWEAAAAVAG